MASLDTPRIEAARWELSAARRAAAAEGLGALPRLDGSFQWTWTENQGFQPEPTYWVAMVRATWTPLEGGRRLHATRAAQARARAAEAALANTRREAEEQELVASARLASSRRSALARVQELALAEEALRLAEEAFGQGTGDWLTVQASRLDAEEARLGMALAHMEQAVAGAELEAARGGAR